MEQTQKSWLGKFRTLPLKVLTGVIVQVKKRFKHPPANGQPAAPLFAGYCAHPKAWDELFAKPAWRAPTAG